ncbi:MAG: ABC transporter permease [Gemmatimonadota bacterium]|nr:ABC transporter permease [Gemmatimonadota bacterium]
MLRRALFAALITVVPAAAAGQQTAPARVVEIALEQRLADSLNLSVGDTVRFGTEAAALDRLAVVAAIYRPPPDPATILRRDYRARLHLSDMEAVTGQPDRIDRIGVALEAGADPAAAAELLNRTAFGFHAYPSAELAAESSRTFAVVSRFHRAIAVITTVASAVFLLCIMLLKVEERRIDAAVMRFIGVRRRTIFGALLLEAAALAVIGSMIGILVAEAASAITNRYYQRVFETELVFSLLTPGIVTFGVGLSLLLGLLAGAVAAGRLVNTAPMTLWRRG